MTLTRKSARAAKAETGAKWRSLDPILVLVSLALSAFGILAVYVAGDAARQTYATNQAFGFFVGLAGAVPLALIDYRYWQRHLRLIYGLVFLKALGILSIPALLVFTQPDLGTALVFGAIFVSMSYIAGAKLIQLAGLVAAGAVAAFLAVRLNILEDY